METLLTRLIEALIMPPGLMFAMMIAGTVLLGRFYRTGKTLLIGGFGLLLLSSIPLFGNGLLALLEATPATSPRQVLQQQAQAIVILGGGRYAEAPEYQAQDTVSRSTLERLRYGAYLHQHTALPILVTGGKPFERPLPEAELMRASLIQDFKTPVRWLEGRSNNTWQNAQFSYEILKPAGIERIVLVTHAWHMPRAVVAFEQQGFIVLPAPTAFSNTGGHPWLLDIVPDPDGLVRTRMAMHELIGRLWYALRY